MPTPLLPNAPGALAQRNQVQPFMGPATLYNPLTVGNAYISAITSKVAPSFATSVRLWADATGTVGLFWFSASGTTIGQAPPLIGDTQVVVGNVQCYQQVGVTVGTPNANGNITHTFPNAFPVGLDVVVCCNGNASNNSHQLTTVDKSNGFGIASFASRSIDCTTGTPITTAIEIMWIAWGH